MSSEERTVRLDELALACNQILDGFDSLLAYQEKLYDLIQNELSNHLGHYLGPWEYDSEIEYWGGKSYMDSSIDDELLLKSQFPDGIELSWGDFKWCLDKD